MNHNGCDGCGRGFQQIGCTSSLSMKSYESLRLLRQRDQTNQSNADMAHAFTRAQNVTELSNMFIIVYIRLFHPAAREIPPLAWILRAQPCPWIDAQLRDC